MAYRRQNLLHIQDAHQTLVQKISNAARKDSVNNTNSLSIISKAPREFIFKVGKKRYCVNKFVAQELCLTISQLFQQNNNNQNQNNNNQNNQNNQNNNNNNQNNNDNNQNNNNNNNNQAENNYNENYNNNKVNTQNQEKENINKSATDENENKNTSENGNENTNENIENELMKQGYTIYELPISDPEDKFQLFADICNGKITSVNAKKDKIFFITLSQILGFILPCQWTLPSGIRHSKCNKQFPLSLSPGSAANFLMYNHDFFTVSTRQKKYQFSYLTATFSEVFSELLKKDHTIREYQYDFDDKNSEFMVVSEFFKGNSIHVTPQNLEYVKQISEDLKIPILISKVEQFKKEFEFSQRVLDVEMDETASLIRLQETLFDLDESNLTFVIHDLENSIWVSSTEFVKEFISNIVVAACYRHSTLHSLCQLCKYFSEKDTNFLMFLTKFVLNIANDSILLCPFVYYLSQNDVIPIEQILKFIVVHTPTEKNEITNSQNVLFLFFLPELLSTYPHIESRLKSLVKNYFYPSIDDYNANNYFAYRESRNKMQNQDLLAISIAKDDTVELQKQMMQISFDNSKMIFPNPFDNIEKLSLVNYSAFRSSINCFKYLILNGSNINKSTFINAVIGGNSEIIRICEQKLKGESISEENVNNDPNNIVNNLNQHMLNVYAMGNMNQRIQMLYEPNQTIVTEYPGRSFYGRPMDNEYLRERGWHNNIFGGGYMAPHLLRKSTRFKKNKKDFNCGLGTPILSNSSKVNINDFILYTAASYHRYGVFEWFIQQSNNQATLLEPLLTCFRAATESNNIKSLMFIIDNGVSLNDQSSLATNLVNTAAKYGFYDVFRVILAAAGDEVILDQISGKALALISACEFGSNLIINSIFETNVSIAEEDIKTAIHTSIMFQNEDIFYDLVDRCKFNIANDFKNLVQVAVNNGCVGVLMYLLEHNNGKLEKASIDSICSSAALNGQFECLKVIFNNVDQNDLVLSETLSAAAKSGQIEIVKFLIENGVTLENDAIKPTISAIAQNGFADILELLFSIFSENKKNRLAEKYITTAISNRQILVSTLFVQLSNVSGTALINAAGNGLFDVVEAMVKKNNSPKFINTLSQDGTALCAAAAIGNIEITKLLISQPGVDVHLYNRFHFTALIIAAKNNFFDIVKLLAPFSQEKKYHWEMNAAFRMFFSKTPLPSIFGHPLPNPIKNVQKDFFDMKAAQFFLNFSGIDVNFVFGGKTVFEEALGDNCFPLIELLLQRPELDASIITSSGMQVFPYAAQYCDLKILEILFSHPKIAPTIGENEILEIFMNIIANSRNDVIKFMISESSPIKANSHMIVRAVESALKISNDIILKLLLALDFDINLKMPYQHSSLLIAAAENRSYEAVSLIIAHPQFAPDRDDVKKALFHCLSANDSNITNNLLAFLDNDVNQFDKNGESLLVEAVSFPSNDNTNYILLHPSFNAEKSMAKRAFFMSLQKGQNIINLFLASGFIDINEPYDESFSFIHGQFSTNLKNLLDDKEKAVLPNCFVGWTPLMISALINEIQNTIIQTPNIDVNKKGKNGSAPIFEAIQARSNLLEILLNHKDFDVNIQNEKGWTPLIAAILLSDFKTASKILKSKHECNIFIKDKQEMSAIDYIRLHEAFEDDIPKSQQEMHELISKYIRKNGIFEWDLDF